MQLDQLRKNHMDILWHEYTDAGGENRPVTEASLTEKASIIGGVGIMLLSCGTGAWRVRSSMNTLAEVMGITCTADIGLMSIEYTCFDGEDGYTQALCLTNTGVNTSKLNRLEKFIRNFEKEGKHISGEQLHWRRCWKLCAVQIDKTPFYFVFVYCIQCIISLFYLCGIFKTGRNFVGNIHST